MSIPACRRPKWLIAVAVTLGGGTLFGTCQMRLRDAFVDGSKQVLSSFLDASLLTEFFENQSEDPSEEGP